MLELGLMRVKTLKLYLGNLIVKADVYRLLWSLEEYAVVKLGLSNHYHVKEEYEH